MNTNTERREFIKTGAAAGIGLGLAAALPTWLRAQPPSPSGRLRVAVIGTNSRGLEHIECLGGISDVEIAYICDVEDGALAKGMKKAAAATHDQPKALKDFRRALDDKTIDADDDRGARPLAHADGDHGDGGRQARLRRETLQPQPRGGRDAA